MNNSLLSLVKISGENLSQKILFDLTKFGQVFLYSPEAVVIRQGTRTKFNQEDFVKHLMINEH